MVAHKKIIITSPADRDDLDLNCRIDLHRLTWLSAEYQHRILRPRQVILCSNPEPSGHVWMDRTPFGRVIVTLTNLRKVPAFYTRTICAYTRTICACLCNFLSYRIRTSLDILH